VTQAREQLGGSAAVYLDGGPADHAVASTIVDLTGEHARILRVGAIPTEQIAEVLGVTAESLVPGAS
jgi:tRNA A37 threonylcarbamoyladenosine synthetase subunit TsaC/SUA5/YrdC